ncbi:hypothetical protein Tco_0120921 [Tanacetum coccineum]
MCFNHDKCVVKSVKFVKKPPVKKVWRVKQVKQVWQATRKLFANVGHQWIPTGRKITLGEQCPLTRFTQSKVVSVKQPKNVSTKRLSNTSQKPITRTPTEIGDPTYQTLHIFLFSNAGRTDRPLVFGLSYFRLQPAFQSEESISPKRQLFLSTDSSLVRLPDSGLQYLPDSGLIVLIILLCVEPLRDNMANENVPAPAPTRSDDQILLFAAWLDEARFVLDANLLREALEITPIDQAYQFVSPLSGDAIIDFVNELGYTEEIHFVSRMAVNNLYQPWRAICHMLNHVSQARLWFVPKGKDNEVFGIPIPNELITNNIKNAPYYNAYLEMVAKHDQKIATKKGGKKKPATAKQLKPKPVKEKSTKPAPAPKLKVTQENPAKPSHAKHPKGGKAITTEEQAAQSLLALHMPKRRSATNQFILQRCTPATEEASTGPSTQPQDDTSANIVHDSPSICGCETSADTGQDRQWRWMTEILQIGEEQSEDVANMMNLEEKTTEIDEGQARSDPGKTPESRPPLDDDKMDEYQARLDPGESQDPQISSETLSLMKNLDDAYTIGDQFLNDKSTEDEPRTLNVEAEVVSMVTVPIHQADLPEADMKEMLHQQMFESGSYKSHSEHIALYEALKAYMERAQKDEFLTEKDKSRKRRHDDQYPLSPPPKDTNQNKKRRHTSDASVEDVPMPDTAHMSDSEDTDSVYLPKIKLRPDWLKPVPEEDKPASPKPDWVLPLNDLPETENN